MPFLVVNVPGLDLGAEDSTMALKLEVPDMRRLTGDDLANHVAKHIIRHHGWDHVLSWPGGAAKALDAFLALERFGRSYEHNARISAAHRALYNFSVRPPCWEKASEEDIGVYKTLMLERHSSNKKADQALSQNKRKREEEGASRSPNKDASVRISLPCPNSPSYEPTSPTYAPPPVEGAPSP